jgi:hypothetical protein
MIRFFGTGGSIAQKYFVLMMAASVLGKAFGFLLLNFLALRLSVAEFAGILSFLVITQLGNYASTGVSQGFLKSAIKKRLYNRPDYPEILTAVYLEAIFSTLILLLVSLYFVEHIRPYFRTDVLLIMFLVSYIGISRVNSMSRVLLKSEGKLLRIAFDELVIRVITPLILMIGIYVGFSIGYLLALLITELMRFLFLICIGGHKMPTIRSAHIWQWYVFFMKTGAAVKFSTLLDGVFLITITTLVTRLPGDNDRAQYFYALPYSILPMIAVSLLDNVTQRSIYTLSRKTRILSTNEEHTGLDHGKLFYRTCFLSLVGAAIASVAYTAGNYYLNGKNQNFSVFALLLLLSFMASFRVFISTTLHSLELPYGSVKKLTLYIGLLVSAIFYLTANNQPRLEILVGFGVLFYSMAASTDLGPIKTTLPIVHRYLSAIAATSIVGVGIFLSLNSWTVN